MWFTVATIVFVSEIPSDGDIVYLLSASQLPLSFMASFLALEVSEFPWSNDKLSLSFVLQILCKFSLEHQRRYRGMF